MLRLAAFGLFKLRLEYVGLLLVLLQVSLDLLLVLFRLLYLGNHHFHPLAKSFEVNLALLSVLELLSGSMLLLLSLQLQLVLLNTLHLLAKVTQSLLHLG